MKLMRDDMRELISNVNNAHAGLLIQRGLTDWEDGEKSIKQKLINTISGVYPDEIYQLAFERWLVSTYHTESEQNNPNFAHLSGQVIGRLYTGLALGSTLETGVSTHHTYGMPIIAGSSVKGAVRNYAELLFAIRNEDGTVKLTPDRQGVPRSQIDPSHKPIIDVLFGTGGDEDSSTDSADNAGYIIWHDAWWIPHVDSDGNLKKGEGFKPFVSEVVTVHHQKYYSGELPQALDMESPVPNQQLAVQGCFYFTIEGNGETEAGKKWLKLAEDLLTATIQNQGLGAKSSSGYGYFQLENSQIHDIWQSILKKRAEADKKKQLKTAMENASPLMQKLLDAISANNWDTGKEKDRQSFSKDIDIWLDELEAPNADIQAIEKFIEIHKLFFESHWRKKPKNDNGKKRIKRLKALKAKLS